MENSVLAQRETGTAELRAKYLRLTELERTKEWELNRMEELKSMKMFCLSYLEEVKVRDGSAEENRKELDEISSQLMKIKELKVMLRLCLAKNHFEITKQLEKLGFPDTYYNVRTI